MTAATANVHRELAGFQAISEFPDTASNGLPAIRDACWIAAWMPIAHSYNAANPLTAQELVRLRADMTSKGDWTNGGIPMSYGERYVREALKLQTLYPADWQYHSGGTEAEVIHQALKVHAGINGCILQLGAAHNLPYNEAGVNSHFIGIGGIDSAAGYLVANGDDVNALAGNGGHAKVIPTRWLSWGQILKAVPTALLVIVHPDPAQIVGVPAGWKDDGTTLTAKNGVPMVKGVRNLILGQEWNPDNVPYWPEQSSGWDSFQVFRDATVEWSQATGIVIKSAGPLQRAYIALASLPAPDPAGPAALAALHALRTALESA
jgi:hypothetical protein